MNSQLINVLFLPQIKTRFIGNNAFG